mmetsp:Transcript_57625/g.123900  ORF Transcript_57625/g.123900 Transcript_57625/m.123900 type:complete len:403 (-) Transcript_57625:15-1223(-)
MCLDTKIHLHQDTEHRHGHQLYIYSHRRLQLRNSLRRPHLDVFHLLCPHPQFLELADRSFHLSQCLLSCCPLAAPFLSRRIEIRHCLLRCCQRVDRRGKSLGCCLLCSCGCRIARLQSHQRSQPSLCLLHSRLCRSQLLGQLRNMSLQPIHCGPSSGLFKLRHRRCWLLQNRGQSVQQGRIKPLRLLQESAHLLNLLLHLLLLHSAAQELRERGLNGLHGSTHLQHGLYSNLFLTASRQPSGVGFALRIKGSQTIRRHCSLGFQKLLSTGPSLLCFRHNHSELSPLGINAGQRLVHRSESCCSLLLLALELLTNPRHHLLMHRRPILLLQRKRDFCRCEENLQRGVFHTAFLELRENRPHAGSHRVHWLRHCLLRCLGRGLLSRSNRARHGKNTNKKEEVNG